jgi:2-polyprenyl-3-methyl-5-hydroxy-6-metoxy-1,4-benzoquinol methylase
VNQWLGLESKYRAATSADKDPIRHNVLLPEILYLVGNVKGLAVVDVGCGPGYLISALARFLPRRLVASDISEEMVASAISNTPDAEPMLLDITKQNLPAKEFDLITCIMVVHSIDDLSSCIRNLASGLVCSGRLIIAIPHPCFHFEQAQINRWSNYSGTPPVGQSSKRQSYFLNNRLKNRFGTPCVEIEMIHRPISEYVEAFFQAELSITALREPGPHDTKPWINKPPFLLLAGQKKL